MGIDDGEQRFRGGLVADLENQASLTESSHAESHSKNDVVVQALSKTRSELSLSDAKKKDKKIGAAEEVQVETAPPPYYAPVPPAVPAASPFWRTRRALLIAIGLLVLLIALLATLLGVLLLRNHGTNSKSVKPPPRRPSEEHS
jgi:hypothetical protein